MSGRAPTDDLCTRRYDGEAARLVLAIADGSLREVDDIAPLLARLVALGDDSR